MRTRPPFPSLFTRLKTAALAGALLAAGLQVSEARQVMGGISAEPKSGIEIEASSDFDNLLPYGGVPFRVRIQNRTARSGEWRFAANSERFGGGGIRVEQDLRVEPGQTRSFAIIVPFMSDSSYSNLQISVTGRGMKGSTAALAQNNWNTGGSRTRTLAMSKDLAARSWEPLRKHFETGKRTFDATQFDAASLPESWRGFAGIEWLALSETEWNRLAPPVRSAIRQWVGFGGHLLVAARDPATVNWSDFRLGPGGGPADYGFGDVRALAWDGKEMPEMTFDPLLTAGTPLAERRGEMENLQWAPAAALGKWAPPGGLVIALVVGLAVVIGPVNLFYLAPAGRRHRLFFTTPLLSLGGSLLLVATILMRDGIGGAGNRFTLIRLLPGANEAVVLQDQVSRTGLLLSSRFSIGEEALIFPVLIGERRVAQTDFAIAGRDYFGDWFRSRTIQVQALSAVRPTRAALTRLGFDASGAPQVVSSFETPLAKLVMRDAEGKLWQADDLATGEKVTLRPAVEKDSRRWWEKSTDGARGESRMLLTPEPGQAGGSFKRGCFYAVAAAPGGHPIETLRSIRWRESRVAVIGPVAEGGTP